MIADVESLFSNVSTGYKNLSTKSSQNDFLPIEHKNFNQDSKGENTTSATMIL